MTPSDAITAYLRQSRRRWVMFLIATIAGLAVAVPVMAWAWRGVSFYYTAFYLL
jgi:hypothetical protein